MIGLSQQETSLSLLCQVIVLVLGLFQRETCCLYLYYVERQLIHTDAVQLDEVRVVQLLHDVHLLLKVLKFNVSNCFEKSADLLLLVISLSLVTTTTPSGGGVA